MKLTKFLIVMFVLSVASVEINIMNNTPKNYLKDITSNFFHSEQMDFNILLDQITKHMFKLILNIVSNFIKGLSPTNNFLPMIQDNTWWGDKPEFEDTSIRPFKVKFDNEMINDLRYRIHYHRNITQSLENSYLTYGTNQKLLNSLLEFWEYTYNFNRDNLLNRYSQYITNIQGLDIHFIHVKPKTTKKSVPLLMLHGWPLTAFEYLNVIDDLIVNDDSSFSIEIIVPNLPGFGYSQGTNKIGLAPYQIGVILNNLMKRLGHNQYYLHAYDVGHWVGEAMTTVYQDNILGFHSSMAYSLLPQTLVKYLLGQLYPSAVVEPQYEKRMYPISTLMKSYILNTGYLHMQATRPDTIGNAVNGSPMSLVSWLIPNYIASADRGNLLHLDGRITENFSLSDLFDTITVYWHTQCIVTSSRIYAENFAFLQNPLNLIIAVTPTKVPFAALKSRNEIIYQPDDFLQDKYNKLVQSTTLDYGGHILSYEHPNILSTSIRSALSKFEIFHTKNPLKDIIT